MIQVVRKKEVTDRLQKEYPKEVEEVITALNVVLAKAKFIPIILRERDLGSVPEVRRQVEERLREAGWEVTRGDYISKVEDGPGSLGERNYRLA